MLTILEVVRVHLGNPLDKANIVGTDFLAELLLTLREALLHEHHDVTWIDLGSLFEWTDFCKELAWLH